jgi:hypothetical protein
VSFNTTGIALASAKQWAQGLALLGAVGLHRGSCPQIRKKKQHCFGEWRRRRQWGYPKKLAHCCGGTVVVASCHWTLLFNLEIRKYLEELMLSSGG